MTESTDLGKPLQAATRHTCDANAALAARLDFTDESCFDDAMRGFVGTIPNARITGKGGFVVWDVSSYEFLEQTLPDSVNPSLWRQARLNKIHGLFEVAPGMYQVRGFDLANMTIIEGDTGLIIIDPLMVSQTAEAALNLYREHRGDRPVKAVIYSHSHPDHYGGVEGVMTSEQGASGEVHVIAPEGFLEEAISETILAGVPMRRRSMFQFGPTLAPGERSHVDSGLGKCTPRGSTSLIAPNWTISDDIETHVIDGVEIVFQLTPETEAPAEMNFFFPSHRVLNLAENGCHTMHNLCPIRGAKTRDSLAWSKYLDDALNRFVDDTDTVIAQHHWPTWGQDRVRRFLTEQRDLYRYLHDQTLRLMSHGMTPNEIADEIAMPLTLEKSWHARPYYGAIAHNVRAVYCHYMGPYDGNPTNLNPLPPVAAGKRYVEYMGGPDAVLERAQKDYDAGNYRWVVQVMHHVVFADPENEPARSLAANAMEQLGYQAESSTWRNAYLLGAKELRHGPPPAPRSGLGAINPRVVAMMPIAMFLDFLAIRVNGPDADGKHLLIDWQMTDKPDDHRLTLSHGALNHSPGSHGEKAQATVRISRKELSDVVLSGKPFVQALDENEIPHAGDTATLRELLALLDTFHPMFNILEP
jgi:alkyl sulfatase BDS1-like metallo-beta-lactamase superfamily hydrolase